MIPFYMDRLRYITEEYEHKRDRGASEPELVFLDKTRNEVQKSLDKEKLEVKKMANELYSLWTKIMEQRKFNKFLSTNVELKVHS